MNNLKLDIEKLLNNSINNKNFTDSIFFDLPLKAQIELKKILFKSFEGYKCEINSHDIRHVNRGHSEDINYIMKIPEILADFDDVKKSFVENKKTRKTEHAVEFYKKYDKNNVKVVKIHLRKNKILRLKTLFIKG